MIFRKILSKYKIINKILLVKIILFYCIFGTINSVSSQEKSNYVRVATKSFPPFAFEENGQYVGFSLDLWSEIAKELNIEYEIYGEESIINLLKSVSEDNTDIGVAGITITSEREQKVDFSYPFFESGLQILVSTKNISPLQTFFSLVFSPILWSAILFLLIMIIFAAHLMWYLERKKNSEMFPEKYLEGIWEAFWWAVVTVVTVGYGDKTPKGVAGRILATIWMFTGVVLISYFTASVTSALTIQGLGNNINDFQDLKGKPIGTVKETTAATFLSNTPNYVIEYNTIEEAYVALEEGKINAIIYDSPVLRYYAQGKGSGSVKVVGSVFEPQSYGIALKQNSQYRESINQAILKLKENGTYTQIYQKWFGK
ncbi:transporter substrate-binding domain-containing protein [Geminocystis sp.]|uniref:transporter substrate-binding domain-containing protein n=1 Tax=Geminocystis sp. TaxID=2664100 RepID=UPI0035934784